MVINSYIEYHNKTCNNIECPLKKLKSINVDKDNLTKKGKERKKI